MNSAGHNQASSDCEPRQRGLHLGTTWADKGEATAFYLSTEDLLTHVFVCGITGSGKTVLGKAILEEAALQGIPCLAVDLKGDLSSLAIKLAGLSPADFLPYVDELDPVKREVEARALASLYHSSLRRDGLGLAEVQRFNAQVEVGIFTPLSERGIRLGVPMLSEPPENLSELRRTDPQAVMLMVDGAASDILRKVSSDGKVGRLREEHALLVEIISQAWARGVSLRGAAGLRRLLEMVLKPPFRYVGAMAVDDFIGAKRRGDLARRLNSLLVGVDALWPEGVDVSDIEALIAGGQGTPIRVINLAGLDSYEDRNFVIAQVCLAIYNWMFRQGGTISPRLLLFIDEIGGGGGATAVFPSHPYQSVSKPPLNLLVRQGRAFGVSVVMATQNPGDVDYKGLSNCHTWMIGRLATRRDREKVLQGISETDLPPLEIEGLVAGLNTGEFVVKTKTNQVKRLRERWLYTLHKTVAFSDLPALVPDSLRARYAGGAPAAGEAMVVSAERIPAEVGPYRVIGTLGEGGFGTVYLAETAEGRPRKVAIKVAREEEFIERMRREATLLDQMRSWRQQSIVRIEGVDTQGDTPYVVMEYLAGGALADRLRFGKLPLADCLDIAEQILKALDYAHRRGVVHRDIKPSNVMFVKKRSNRIKLTDFGLGQCAAALVSMSFAEGREPEAPPGSESRQSIEGTFAYMSPEQQDPEMYGEVDARADLFSLGVVFYEMLTGERPMGSFALPSRKDPTIPAALDEVVGRLLEPSPEGRYQSAAAVLCALEEARRDVGRRVETGEQEPGPDEAMVVRKRTTFRRPLYPSRKADLPLPVIVGAGSIVRGFVFGQEVDVEADSTVEGLIFGQRQVWIGDRCALEGPVISLGEVRVGRSRCHHLFAPTVRLSSSARVHGTIRCQMLEIEEGASAGGLEISGDLRVAELVTIPAEATLATVISEAEIRLGAGSRARAIRAGGEVWLSESCEVAEIVAEGSVELEAGCRVARLVGGSDVRLGTNCVVGELQAKGRVTVGEGCQVEGLSAGIAISLGADVHITRPTIVALDGPILLTPPVFLAGQEVGAENLVWLRGTLEKGLAVVPEALPVDSTFSDGGGWALSVLANRTLIEVLRK